MRYTKFADIPQITRAHYRINVSWPYLEEQLAHFAETGLELEPDFQRAHVWTEEQQIRYVEWVLRNGKSGREILWNCPGWQRNYDGPVVLVDGLQRITAARKFMNNEIPVFGSYCAEYTDRLHMIRADFIFYVNDLTTRAEVLQWYLDINSGGTAHTSNELDKVRELLKKEKG
jgi:hypothetical protein